MSSGINFSSQLVHFVPNKYNIKPYNVISEPLIFKTNIFPNFKSDDDLSEFPTIENGDVYGDVFVQLDGGVDLPPHGLPLVSQSHTRRILSAPAGASSLRQATFKLNQKKQVSKLKQDALLTDFNITVSPTEQSVSVMCSTGFYALVAVPALSSITVGSKHHIADVILFCNDITGKIDDIGANVNAVIHFRYTNSDQSSSGGIVVHMHHTVRRVQVQGSSMVNGRMRASVWFVENFLLEQFTVLSQNKAIDISKFNDAVTKMVTNHVDKMNATEKCDVCSGLFNGRSIREQCPLCTKNFHKKCSMGHSCAPMYNQNSSMLTSMPNSLNKPTLSEQSLRQLQGPSIMPAPPTLLDNSSSVSLAAVTVSPPPSLAAIATTTTTGLGASSPQVTVVDRIIQNDDNSSNTGSNQVSKLNPDISPFMPKAGPSTDKGKGKGKNRTKPGLATTSDGIDIEFAKIEVNTIRAKLNNCEKQVKDLEFQNSILLERLSVFEKSEKQKIYDQYFPKPSGGTSSNHGKSSQSCNQPHTPPPPPCWYCRPQCCQSQCRGQSQPQLSPAVTSEALESVLKSIDALRSDVDQLKSRPDDIQGTSSTNKHARDRYTSEMNCPNISASQEECLDLSQDDSIMTVDENVPELPPEESLNSYVLTTQLHQAQLRQ